MSDEEQSEPDLNDQMRERARSLEQIVQLGFDPYPHKFERTHNITQIVEQFSEKSGDELEAMRKTLRGLDRQPIVERL